MPRYTTEEIKAIFTRSASIRISQKRRGDERYKKDAGYWDGGRCAYGGAHNLQEDCERLAKFFSEITELKNARKDLLKFDNRTEFEKNQQNLLTKAKQAINGLQLKTGANTSVGGICIIWDSFSDLLGSIVEDFRRDLERLKNDIERVSYNEAKELKRLTLEERQLKQEIEENERKAQKESDPTKKAKFLFLVNEAKEKWKKVLERKKQLKSANLGNNFDPNKHIDDFLKKLEDKLNRKPPKPPLRTPFNPTGANNGSTGIPSNPFDPFQPSHNPADKNWWQENKQLLIFSGIALALTFYLYSQKETEENYYDY